MNNIEEIFKKQLDKQSKTTQGSKEEIDFDEILSQIPNDDEYQKKLEEKIKEMSGGSFITDNIKTATIDTRDPIQKFRDEYPKTNVEDLTRSEEDVRVVIEHAFCPNCGEELISTAPIMHNPFTLEKLCKIECKCGFKANLNKTVPHVKYVNKNNEEIEIIE